MSCFEFWAERDLCSNSFFGSLCGHAFYSNCFDWRNIELSLLSTFFFCWMIQKVHRSLMRDLGKFCSHNKNKFSVVIVRTVSVYFFVWPCVLYYRHVAVVGLFQVVPLLVSCHQLLFNVLLLGSEFTAQNKIIQTNQ